MEELELFELVKTNLRVFGKDFDQTEIIPLINAAQEDITNSTGQPFDINSYMQCLAVVSFVKAYFGSNSDQEKYLARYHEQLAKLGIQKAGDSSD